MTRNGTTTTAGARTQTATEARLLALKTELKTFLPKGWTAEPVKYFGPGFDMILVAGPKAKAKTAKRQQVLALFDVIRDNFTGLSLTTDGPELYIVPEDWKAPRGEAGLNDGQRMNRAFAALRKLGFFAKQNYQCCQGCGLAAMPKGTERWAFYHHQDADRGWSKTDGHTISDAGIYIAWGEEKPEIGAEIVSALRAEGLKVEWDGGLHTRILVKHFEEHVAASAPNQWPKFKLTKPNGLDPADERIVEMAEAIELMGEETVNLMIRQPHLTVRLPGDRVQEYIRLFPLEESIRDAAPEMLQALKDVRDAYQKMFDSMPVAFQTYDHICAEAIAKAERIAA